MCESRVFFHVCVPIVRAPVLFIICKKTKEEWRGASVCMCVFRLEEQISVQPPQAAFGGSTKLFIPHRDSRRWVLVRNGSCCLRMLGFHKRKWRGGGDINEELVRKLELTGAGGKQDK